MRFTGQIRVPDVDHPGVPVTFVVDDNQAEVILEGDSLGRWSLFDVHVTRLVSSAFQVELADEEITFLADEPVDFAYNGVEHMAQVWARYKTMTVPRRVIAVKRSRKGTTPSRLQEFREAMIENLRAEGGESSSRGEPSMLPGESVATAASPTTRDPLLEPVTEPNEAEDGADAVIPMVAGSNELDRASAKTELEAIENAEAQRAKATLVETERRAEADRMAVEREALAAERVRLDEQKRSLEEALAEAEHLEKKRLDAAQVDMDRIESEKRELEKRHEEERLKAEQLETERQALQQLEVDRVERERQQEKDLAARHLEVEELETRKRAEAERLEKERKELVRLDAEREETARIEMEKLELERLELERLESERLQRERDEADRVEKQGLAEEKQRLADEKREAKRLKKEKEAAAAIAAAEAETEPETDAEEEPDGRVAEVLGTSVAGDLPDNAKELVVDLGAFEEVAPIETPQSGTDTEPAMAGVTEKAGIMGAVKAAFSRTGKNHVHEFTEAPGGIGMVRYICRECGYVSISSTD